MHLPFTYRDWSYDLLFRVSFYLTPLTFLNAFLFHVLATCTVFDNKDTHPLSLYVFMGLIWLFLLLIVTVMVVEFTYDPKTARVDNINYCNSPCCVYSRMMSFLKHIPSKESKAKDNCPICLSPLRGRACASPSFCGHWFHRRCLVQWFEQQKAEASAKRKTCAILSCPYCVIVVGSV